MSNGDHYYRVFPVSNPRLQRMYCHLELRNRPGHAYWFGSLIKKHTYLVKIFNEEISNIKFNEELGA